MTLLVLHAYGYIFVSCFKMRFYIDNKYYNTGFCVTNNSKHFKNLSGIWQLKKIARKNDFTFYSYK